MSGHEAVGQLLRTWRSRVAGLSQAAVAAQLFTSVPAISMWENGQRRLNPDTLEALDACYEAGGTLVDMARALGTSNGMPPRDHWAHNPQGQGGPRWVWLRPAGDDGHVEARVLWGSFGLTISEAADERGVFVTMPVSAPTPTIWVHFRRAGWADFGRGEIPPKLGLPVASAQDLVTVAGDGGDSPAGLVAPHLVDRFRTDADFAHAVRRFFGRRSDLVTQVFNAQQHPVRVTAIEPPEPGTAASLSPHPTGSDMRRLREARGLSLANIARLATDLMPSLPVTDDHVRGLELGSSPRVQYLLSRLDTVYGADGQLCSDRILPRNVAGRHVLEFPRWWVGPVWLELASRWSEPGEVRLEWGSKVKRLAITGEALVTCRRPSPATGQLVVVCPPTWQVMGGIGHRPGARDINFGWTYQQPAGNDVDEAFLNWFGRTQQDFRTFLANPMTWEPAPR